MSAPFVAEVRVVGFNFPPKGWAFCDGQILPLSQNTALFSLLGTTYGGDGKSTFALPDMQGNVVNGVGQIAGSQDYYAEGQQAGEPYVTLTNAEMPGHTHNVRAVPDPADQTTPAPDRSLARSKPGNAYQTTSANLVTMSPQAVPQVGAGLPHNNMQPYLVLNFVIALQGVFPPRG